ncbi:aldose 1-epimerase family protein [Nocardioides pacificus]
MVAPSGEQFEIAAAGYRAVVTEGGGALRHLEHDGRALVDGFAADEMSYGGRGQLLVPWPNRLREGRYEFDGAEHQLGLSEAKRHNASHGLARWVPWAPVEHTAEAVTLHHRLMAQSGYPWTLDLVVRYELSAEGLVVTQAVTNHAAGRAPYASGAHPYLVAGPGPIDGWELSLPASTRSLVDDRLLPVGREPVAGTPYDFRTPRAIGDTVWNDAVTDLDRDDDGRAVVTLRDPAAGTGVQLWVDEQHGWLQVYSADDVPATARRSLAVEPMTAQADAFRSGEDVVVLGAAGQPETSYAASWGIRAL